MFPQIIRDKKIQESLPVVTAQWDIALIITTVISVVAAIYTIGGRYNAIRENKELHERLDEIQGVLEKIKNLDSNDPSDSNNQIEKFPKDSENYVYLTLIAFVHQGTKTRDIMEDRSYIPKKYSYLKYKYLVKGDLECNKKLKPLEEKGFIENIAINNHYLNYIITPKGLAAIS